MQRITGPIRVLYVDDDHDFITMFMSRLESEDGHFEVTTAKSASEGLDHLAAAEFDCIIADYEMPDQNGITFLETVRERGIELPFFLLTGKGSEEIASNAISAGVTDYFQKSSGTDQVPLLRNRIEQAVEKFRAERELDATRRKYEKLVEQNFVGIYIIQGGEFIYVNPKLAEIHGYNRDTIIGMSPLELVAPDERDHVKENLRRRREGEIDEILYQTVGLTRDDEQIDIELHGSRIQYEGEPAIIGAELDITERKEYERELEEQRDTLEILNQVLRHDVRNDLQLVTAYAERLRNTCDSEAANEHITTIKESAENAIDLTKTAREIADLMRSDSSKTQQIDLETVLDTEINEVQSSYPKSVITYETSVPSVRIAADDMLSSVFRNLLKNAIQHNDKDVAEVTVSATEREHTVTVRIADNGPGIPDQQKETIFGQGKQNLDSFGTGIGLFLVDTLVNSYDGEVWIEDNDPDGSVFVVELPIVE